MTDELQGCRAPPVDAAVCRAVKVAGWILDSWRVWGFIDCLGKQSLTQKEEHVLDQGAGARSGARQTYNSESKHEPSTSAIPLFLRD